MRLSRRAIVAGAVSGYASVCIPRYRAGAAEFVYRCATTFPPGFPNTDYVLEAAAKINREANGQFELQVYPNEVLGNVTSTLAQVRLGAIDFYSAGNSSGLSNLVPAAGLDGIPFIFASYEDAWRASDGALGNYMRAQISKADFYPFGKTWDAAFRQIENNVKPINTPDDLKGMKIRVVPSAISVALFKALGARPTPLDASQQYTGLQTHLVDGTDATLSTVESGRFYEVLKYASLTNHSWIGGTMLASSITWAKLPKKLQEIIERNFNAAGLRERIASRERDLSDMAKLKAQGIAFNIANHAEFVNLVRKAGLYTELKANYSEDGWKALQRSTNALV